MDSSNLIDKLDVFELTVDAPVLQLWEMGAVTDMDEIASYLYRGGPHPPQGSTRPPRHFKLSEDDPRPEMTYWKCVKQEMAIFLCTDDKKYKDLWRRLGALDGPSTYAVVALIAGYLGDILGVKSVVLTGFVAVFLYAVSKIGKESFCRYVDKR